MEEVIIMGAGAAGLSAALELADRGYKVRLIEQETLGYGSSGRNPGRMGHGFHYVDFDTAKMYLRASIQVQRKYPDYLIGKELPFDHPLRHGRYFITKDSDNSPKEIIATYEKIKEEYIRLIAEDPANEVFGPPESFFRILAPSEYEDLANPAIVAMGVETAEHLFDWQAFRNDIRSKIIAHPNITLYENTEVTRIKRNGIDEPRFTLCVKSKDSDSEQEFKTDYVVNSTWQNIEKLNNQIGITMIPGARTNRLKALLVVKLPDSLVGANSMFFCMGQHCMYSNLGNGYGMMTFADATNVEASTDLTLSEDANRLLEGKATQEEKDIIARRMLEGVARYIPEMAKATIVDVKYGVVQTAGALTLSDLRDPKSSFHRRDYDGIREEQIGLISNPCMKLFYFVRNGEVVADLVDAEVLATSLVAEYMANIERLAKKEHLDLPTELKKTIRSSIERYFPSTTLVHEDKNELSHTLLQTMLNKKAVTQELKQKLSPTQEETSKELVSPQFFMKMICSMSLNKVGLILLAAAIGTFVVGVSIACPPLIAIGAAAAISASLLAGGFFATKSPDSDKSKKVSSILRNDKV